MNTELAKENFQKQLEKVEGLADEIRVKLHLASLDVKQEWDEKLSPRVFELREAAKRVANDSSEKVTELVEQLERFVANLHPSESSSKS